ncbi:hypothetical protein [Nocardia veterana]|uniref:Uncharacterized protein n=1 Tax=Nocardia veterana TaxID=132249 RepID=A0A7X6LUA1_9NOCA|nr:hypothetical protein [Nocardia veterana]NKY84714.1 hypothetical protein [Nocardia veterana]
MSSIATPTRLRRASATVAATVMIALAGAAGSGTTAGAETTTNTPPAAAQAQWSYLQVVPVEPWPLGWYYGYYPWRLYYWPGMFGSC